MRSRTTSGFTLIELLAVLVIISILAYFLVVNVRSAQEVIEIEVTRNRILTIEAMLEEYGDEQGDYPLSTFTPAQGTPPNTMNIGSECLYLALCGEGGQGEGDLDVALFNTDGDRLSRRLEGFATLELFEIADQWDNPIAYLHNRDYDRKDVYQTYSLETGELIESTVIAHKSSKTKRFQQPRTFQLISAGPDGEFGTEDDIGNFKD